MKNTNSKPSSRLLERCYHWDTFISKGTFLLLIFMLPLVGIAQTKSFTKAEKEAFYQAKQAEKAALENAKILKAEEALLQQKREALQAMGMSKSEIKDYFNPNIKTSQSNTYARVDVLNDNCSSATSIRCGFPEQGTTIGATFDDVGFCGTSNTAPGVWYKYTPVAIGESLTAYTCNQASYDTKISVFSGTCGALTCVGGNDDSSGCSGFTSSIQFEVTELTDYYILVHGFGSATGNFTLSLDCVTPVGNDVCTGALPVTCDNTYTGSTAGKTPNSVDFCGTTLSTAPGVWYVFEGTGDGVTLDTFGSGYDTKLGVFSGSCSDLTCVDGNDDADIDVFTLQSQVTFLSEIGTNYYILVTGFSSASGDFNLNISCTSPPENDFCVDAIEIQCGDGTIAGDTSFASDTDAPAEECTELSFSSVAPGVWYYMEGTGGDIIFDLCGSDYDTKISVYTGSCETGLECYAGNDDNFDACGPGFRSYLQMPTVAGETYYIYVSGFNENSVGTFYMDVTCVCFVDASDCATVYSGYDEASNTTEISTTIGYGVAPYDYVWSNFYGEVASTSGSADTTNTISVMPSEPMVYTVTVTDATGCVSTDTVFVNVIDVSCESGGSGKNNKVVVCHTDENGDSKNLCISANAVEAHLGHGDILGGCDEERDCTKVDPPAPPCEDVTIDIDFDNFPSETSWELVNASGDIVASGDGYGGSSSTSETYCVPLGCYTFTIFDSFGDGICCSFGQGSYAVTTATGTVASGGAFGSSESTNFCTGDTAARSSNISTTLSGSGWSMAPNPTKGNVTLDLSNYVQSNVTIEVMNVTGKVIYNTSVQNLQGSKYQVELNSGLPAGMYFVRVAANGQVSTKKLMIMR